MLSMACYFGDDGTTSPDFRSKAALTPPTSEEWDKDKGSSSDLSDVELDEDEGGAIEPDHYYEGGSIPVFKPTMDQFRSFKKFVSKIDKYGMKSGIVKVIPPKEWIDSLPPLDESVKTIKVKNPITQEFSGVHGTYTQANIEKQRSYNLPQWMALTEESQHQPPARRGERRKNQEKSARGAAPKQSSLAPTESTKSLIVKRKPGRPRKISAPQAISIVEEEGDDSSYEGSIQVPPTPTSPGTTSKVFEYTKQRPTQAKMRKAEPNKQDAKTTLPKSKGRQPKSVSERRKYNRRETTDQVDEAAFVDFDYRAYSHDDYTAERCNELETLYWKSLTFAPPMYGADMPGSLFDDSTTSWNVSKLENILDVMGQKVPGVNTAYLYLGMWKATFAWHLEDVDLYSINYIHFGAPKQWYSISQEDARRFESAMRTIWPNDAKNCSQFLRHKTYLISPALLQSQFNIRVNKLVHYEGEFVITFPYGYHSGYNLGYNCAESVNFATEAWLDYGRIAKKCDCEADSVWVDVADIERKLRGEPTPEYYEETDEDDAEDERPTNLPSPPASLSGKSRQQGRKRNRESGGTVPTRKVKRIKIRIKSSRPEPCVLCPNDMPAEDLLPTDTGRRAHRVCALYTPETYIFEEDGPEMIYDLNRIDKARLDLKCSYCRSKKGACFQCSSKKCTRAYHATCAAAAGVQVEYGPTPFYGEDGTEYFIEAYDFRCRFHRTKRAKNLNWDSLESSSLIRNHVESLKLRDVVQVQYQQGDIFAGTVVEKRLNERTLVIDLLPEGDRIEVEWKWVLALDPAASQLPKPSHDAKPLPSHIDKHTVQPRNQEFGPPMQDDPFCDPQAPQKWAEFVAGEAPRNAAQVRVDLAKTDQLWYYLGRTSTEAKSQFTEDLGKPRHNPAGNFLETVKPVHIPMPLQRRSFAPSYPSGVNYHALNGAMAASRQQMQTQLQQQIIMNRPYQYKPKAHELYALEGRALDYQRGFVDQAGLQTAYQQVPAGITDTILSDYHASPALSAPNPISVPFTATSAANLTHGYARPAVGQSRPGQYPVQPHLYNANQIRESYQGMPRQNLGMLAGSPQPSQPQWNQIPLQSYSQVGSAYPLPQPPAPRAAPMANMVGSSNSVSPKVAIVQASLPDTDYLNHIKQYPYLLNSYLRRPTIYSSPYTADGSESAEHNFESPKQQSVFQPTPLLPGSSYSSYPPRPHFKHDYVPDCYRPAPSPSQVPPSPHMRVHPLQYQTPQEFEQQVMQEAHYPQQMGTGYDKLCAQIGQATVPNPGQFRAGQTFRSHNDSALVRPLC